MQEQRLMTEISSIKAASQAYTKNSKYIDLAYQGKLNTRDLDKVDISNAHTADKVQSTQKADKINRVLGVGDSINIIKEQNVSNGSSGARRSSVARSGSSSLANSFRDLISKNISKIKRADDIAQDKDENIVKIAHALTEADIAAKTAVSVSKKFIESWKEITNMPL